MRSHAVVLLVALITVLGGSFWRVQGQLVGSDCASRGPEFCRECCAEKFLLGTIRRDQSCLTRACRPVASDLGGPAPEPAPPKKSVGKTPPKTAPASVVKAPPTIIEVTPPSSSAASRQADIVLDNAQTQSAGFVAGTSLIIATAVAMLVL